MMRQDVTDLSFAAPAKHVESSCDSSHICFGSFEPVLKKQSTAIDLNDDCSHICFGSFEPALLTQSTATPDTVTPGAIDENDDMSSDDEHGGKRHIAPVFQLAVGTGVSAARNARLNRQLTVRHTFIHVEEAASEPAKHTRPRRARSESSAFDAADGDGLSVVLSARERFGRRSSKGSPGRRRRNVMLCSPLPLVFMDAPESDTMCSPPTQAPLSPPTTRPSLEIEGASDASLNVMPPPPPFSPRIPSMCTIHLGESKSEVADSFSTDIPSTPTPWWISSSMVDIPSTPTGVGIGLTAADAAAALAEEGRRQTATLAPLLSTLIMDAPEIGFGLPSYSSIADGICCSFAQEVVPPPPPASRPGIEIENASESSDDMVPPPPLFSPKVAVARISLVDCVFDSSAQCQTWFANPMPTWGASGVDWFSGSDWFSVDVGVGENTLPPAPPGNGDAARDHATADEAAAAVPVSQQLTQPQPQAQQEQQHSKGGQKKQHRSSANKAAKQRRQEEFWARKWN